MGAGVLDGLFLGGGMSSSSVEAGLWGSGLALSEVCRCVFCCWRFYFVIVIVLKYMAGTGSAG